jgi:threonyl-tRNA synthetase
MKIVTLHCDWIEFEAKKEAIKAAEKIEKKKHRVEECLVAFTAVEKDDERALQKTVGNAAAAIADVAGQVKTKTVVVYPWVHLTSRPSSPAAAQEALVQLEDALKKQKFAVSRAPFGWYKQFSIAVKGHPLAELSREITAVAAVKPKGGAADKQVQAKPGEKHEERAHVKIGRELDIFHMEPELAPGMPFYPPAGALVRNQLIGYMRALNEAGGWEEVWTPHVFKTDLWRTSGHLEAYADRMYVFEKDGSDYGLKPMNCPGHALVIKRRPWSYKDFPVKYSEFGTLYRDEQSGELTGLLRVRALTQDDGHGFVRPDQIQAEIASLIDVVKKLYLDVFGFSEMRFNLSTRGGEETKYIGDAAAWEKATKALRAALDQKKMKYDEKKGEAAFYGPKIDVDVKDSVGTWWQLSTIQLDFNLPERFGIEYVDSDGSKKRPVVIHRALYGSLDRFMGILLEHFKGRLPPWLSPVQVKVLTLSQESEDYGRKAAAALRAAGLRVREDFGAETIGKKIVLAHAEKAPYMAIVGPKEAAAGSVSVRDWNDKQKALKLDEFAKKLAAESASKAAEPRLCA